MDTQPSLLASLALATAIVLVGAELRKIAINRRLLPLWWAALIVLVVAWAGWSFGLFEGWPRWIYGLIRWFFSGRGRFLNYRRWLFVWAASVAGIALILAWDWLIYRRLPHARWRAGLKRGQR